jgi:hypothetical protein
LSQCLKGLNVLVESLFGATFHQIPMREGESWHPDVIKLSLHHPDEVQSCQLAMNAINFAINLKKSPPASIQLFLCARTYISVVLTLTPWCRVFSLFYLKWSVGNEGLNGYQAT